MRCPKCGVELPIFTKDGKHNFCPANSKSGGIVEICQKCKGVEIVARWHGKSFSKAKDP